MKKIETSRLILRNFTDNDYDDLYEFLSQRKDDEFEGYPDINYENGQEHLKYRVGNNEFIAIELKDNSKVIGNIYLGNREFEAKELGYIINKNYQRKGYATEAINALIKHEFANHLHRLYAECSSKNESSWQLLESLCFKREAFFKENVFFTKDKFGNPMWQDTYVYSMLNNDRINIKSFSSEFKVRKLNEDDLSEIYKLCLGNPKYYKHCPPLVTFDSIIEDMKALPPNKGYEDKYYIGYFNNDELIAIIDLIDKFPNDETAFIGFFMIKKEYHNQGIGSSIVNELISYLKRLDYKYMRLGYSANNEQSKSFWVKNGFVPTGVVDHSNDLYDVVVMHKILEKV